MAVFAPPNAGGVPDWNQLLAGMPLDQAVALVRSIKGEGGSPMRAAPAAPPLSPDIVPGAPGAAAGPQRFADADVVPGAIGNVPQTLPPQPAFFGPASDLVAGNPTQQQPTPARSGALAMAPAQLAPLFNRLTQQYGLPPGYLATTAQIESRFNPRAVSRTGAKGLFQFTSGTARDMGLTNPFNPVMSAVKAAALARRNGAYLQRVLGRQPTAGELYLAHQEGPAGAAYILTHPNAPVSRNALLNGAKPGMTNAEFAAMWLDRFPNNAAARSSVSIGDLVQRALIPGGADNLEPL